jgi:hypothetical protein
MAVSTGSSPMVSRFGSNSGRGRWRLADHYEFTLQPRAWSDFGPMCQYHQTAPEFALHPAAHLHPGHADRAR